MKCRICTGGLPFLRDAQQPDLLGYGRFRDTEDVPPCVLVSARVHYTTYLREGNVRLSDHKEQTRLTKNSNFKSQGNERKSRRNEPQCKAMVERNDIFGRFGGGHMALSIYTTSRMHAHDISLLATN